MCYNRFEIRKLRKRELILPSFVTATQKTMSCRDKVQDRDLENATPLKLSLKRKV